MIWAIPSASWAVERSHFGRGRAPEEPSCQCSHKDGNHHAHGHTFVNPYPPIGRPHLILREHRADEGDDWDRAADQAAPPGQRMRLSEPPNSAEDIGVE